VTDDRRGKVKITIAPDSNEGTNNTIASEAEHAPSQPMIVGQAETPVSDQPEEIPQVDLLEEARKEADENRDRWTRAVAELENYRKRMAQERSRFQKYQYEYLLRDLLPVLDNLQRALDHCSQAGTSDSFTEGVCMIAGMFRDIMERYGIKEIKALGEPFDPQFHEAIARMPSTDGRSNIVVEEMEKGYLYHDRLLRPARVVVSAEVGQETGS